MPPTTAATRKAFTTCIIAPDRLRLEGSILAVSPAHNGREEDKPDEANSPYTDEGNPRWLKESIP